MNTSSRHNVRNVAIIAHVDHGKTTLVDAMFRQTGEFHARPDEAQECLLDSNALERERGITILAKATSVPVGDITVNILDTPGHADFGGEVERILAMVDGALLLIDAADGPMPQTRFVLKKALELGLRPIVVVNKADRPDARPYDALNRTFDLFAELGANDRQLDFPVLYASGRLGWARKDPDGTENDLTTLFDTIIAHVPEPAALLTAPLQMQVTILHHDPFIGRIATGRIHAGRIERNQVVAVVNANDAAARDGGGANGADTPPVTARITKILRFAGMRQIDIPAAEAGDIVAIAGLETVRVGDTIAHPEHPAALPPLSIEEPTMAVEIFVNDSRFAGRDGRFLTSRHLRERLFHEREINVGLTVTESGGTSSFRVSGRGELHLTVLLETMRREGYEMAVSKPEVLDKITNGETFEPAEDLVVDADEEYRGAVLEALGARGATLKNMHVEGRRMRIEYVITVRALMGFKTELLSLTRGTALLHHSYHGYVPKRREESARGKGVLVAMEEGVTTAYALDTLQTRGTLFVGPNTPVYVGMIIGECAREKSLAVNPSRKKALTNMRAAGSDDNVLLTPPRILTMEQAIAFIDADELVEITPKSIRLRKKSLDAKSWVRAREA